MSASLASCAAHDLQALPNRLRRRCLVVRRVTRQRASDGWAAGTRLTVACPWTHGGTTGRCVAPATMEARTRNLSGQPQRRGRGRLLRSERVRNAADVFFPKRCDRLPIVCTRVKRSTVHDKCAFRRDHSRAQRGQPVASRICGSRIRVRSEAEQQSLHTCICRSRT